MCAMIGAWSLLNNLSNDGSLSIVERRRMRAAVPRSTTEGYRDVSRRGVWLYAPAAQICLSDDLLVAGVGFFVPPGLQAIRETVPQGHFSMLRHDRANSNLTFYRSLSGGERLYFARKNADTVLFSTTIWPLLAILGASVEPGVLNEVLLTGLTMFGSETLHRDIHEVLPGHQLTLDRNIGRQVFHSPGSLVPPVGEPEELARDFRQHLTEAVAASAGPTRPVAVALSGGIDSSAIATAAVDAFGADNVHAITYEFNDPNHSTEIAFAKQVVQKLGIRRHRVFQFDPSAYLAAIPEMIYRSESLVHWPKAFMLLVAREVRQLGYDRYLTGFGIGSHLGYLAELARGLARFPRTLTASWKASRFSPRAWPERLTRFHPALEPPHPRLYYLLVHLLGARGYIKHTQSFFPESLAPLLGRRDVGDEDKDLALGPWLQQRAFARGIACIDVTRSEKASRELGVYRVSPAHFDRCVPYAHYPIQPHPRLYTAERTLRPGKHLLRLAYRNTLPDQVLYRVKSWGDAVASDGWLREGRRLMLSVLPHFPEDTAIYGPHYPEAIRQWESKSILASSLALRLWMRISVELPPMGKPPTWKDLWRSLKEEKACA